jgi:hypothetical protein
MNKDTHTKEYVQKLESLKLSNSSRARMEKGLLEYAQFHSVSQDVRVADETRSIEQVPQRTLLFSLKRMYMPFVILLAVMVSGGTSFAAQGAVPGDFLYTIKTEVNEPVRSAFALGANAEAELQAQIVAERIEEAQELKAEGKLKGEVAAKLAANIQAHVAKAEKANKKSDEKVKIRTNSGLSLALGKFNALVENDAALVISTSTQDSEVSTSAALGTTLATGKIDPETLRANTQTRIESLIEIVKKSEAELSAEVYLALSAKLDDANELLVESKTQTEVQSQQSLMKAGELAGEVESKLTTLGTAKIDVNTGVILDIDFSEVPALKLNLESDANMETRESGRDDKPKKVYLDVETDSVIELDTDSSEAGIEGAVRSGLNI